MPIFDIHTYLEGYALPGINADAGQLAQLLQARGIERAILLSTRAIQADPLSGNRILNAMLDDQPRLYGCLVAHLNRVDASLESIRDLLGSRRFVGVLLTSTDPNEPLHPLIADEILNACRRYQKPIFLPAPNAACVEIALKLAIKYNMHKFVLLGMGGRDWRAGIAAAQQSVNISLETSGVLDRVKIPAAVGQIGAHRVLFGSGVPHLDPVAALGLIDDSDLSSLDRRRILNDNAAKLFRIDEAD